MPRENPIPQDQLGTDSWFHRIPTPYPSLYSPVVREQPTVAQSQTNTALSQSDLNTRQIRAAIDRVYQQRYAPQWINYNLPNIVGKSWVISKPVKTESIEPILKIKIPTKDYTDMAFGARKIDEPFDLNGKHYKQTWYICLRKGRVIKGTAYPTGDPNDWIDFRFKSQKQAKACANELNEKYWTTYKDNMEVMEGFDKADEMINTIKGYL